MSDPVYSRTCAMCGHKINHHDANECWMTVNRRQCECGWMGVPDGDELRDTRK